MKNFFKGLLEFLEVFIVATIFCLLVQSCGNDSRAHEDDNGVAYYEDY